MPYRPIITVIGAASTTFGPKVLRDILNHPAVGGYTLRFVDINEDHRRFSSCPKSWAAESLICHESGKEARCR